MAHREVSNLQYPFSPRILVADQEVEKWPAKEAEVNPEPSPEAADRRRLHSRPPALGSRPTTPDNPAAAGLAYGR